MPCFARGSSLLNPNGYRKIERLKPGDTLITAKGDRRALRWIGHRTLDFSRAKARRAAPVLIMANAFGPGQPLCPLRLSPLHGVFVDGVLVPAVHLVNGPTIIREAVPATLTYYHVLERHDIVMVDGLLVRYIWTPGTAAGCTMRPAPAAHPVWRSRAGLQPGRGWQNPAAASTALPSVPGSP